MRKFIYQVGNEYFIVEADSLQAAMVAVMNLDGTVIGEYTKFAHLFGD